MPTPERIQAASREKRKRVCAVCGAHFMVRDVSRKGVTCSPACLRKHQSQRRLGTKQSAETIAKRAASIRAYRADPDKNARWTAAAAQGSRQWMADPANRKAVSERSSAWMNSLHASPSWRGRRSEISSATMRANWKKYHDKWSAYASERYQRGEGLNTPEARAAQARAGKWIFKKAQEALHADTDYDMVWTETHNRLRREMPYDGPAEGSDYIDYLRKLGRATAQSPECVGLLTSFMSEAIPRFADAWQKRKLAL